VPRLRHRVELPLDRFPPTMRFVSIRPKLVCTGCDAATRLRSVTTSEAISRAAPYRSPGQADAIAELMESARDRSDRRAASQLEASIGIQGNERS
jgi:hypothetical protein